MARDLSREPQLSNAGFAVSCVGVGLAFLGLVFLIGPLVIVGSGLVLGALGVEAGQRVGSRWRDSIRDKAWCEGYDDGKAEAERVYGLTLNEGQTRIGWAWPEPDDFLAPEECEPPLAPEEVSRLLRERNDSRAALMRFQGVGPDGVVWIGDDAYELGRSEGQRLKDAGLLDQGGAIQYDTEARLRELDREEGR